MYFCTLNCEDAS